MRFSRRVCVHSDDDDDDIEAFGEDSDNISVEEDGDEQGSRSGSGYGYGSAGPERTRLGSPYPWDGLRLGKEEEGGEEGTKQQKQKQKKKRVTFNDEVTVHYQDASVVLEESDEEKRQKRVTFSNEVYIYRYVPVGEEGDDKGNDDEGERPQSDTGPSENNNDDNIDEHPQNDTGASKKKEDDECQRSDTISPEKTDDEHPQSGTKASEESKEYTPAAEKGSYLSPGTSTDISPRTHMDLPERQGASKKVKVAPKILSMINSVLPKVMKRGRGKEKPAVAEKDSAQKSPAVGSGGEERSLPRAERLPGAGVRQSPKKGSLTAQEDDDAASVVRNSADTPVHEPIIPSTPPLSVSLRERSTVQLVPICTEMVQRPPHSNRSPKPLTKPTKAPVPALGSESVLVASGAAPKIITRQSAAVLPETRETHWQCDGSVWTMSPEMTEVEDEQSTGHQNGDSEREEQERRRAERRISEERSRELRERAEKEGKKGDLCWFWKMTGK